MRRHRLTWLFAGILLTQASDSLRAQGIVLSLSSATANPGSTVTLPLNLNVSGTAPAALQWTLVYPSSQVSAVSAAAGTAATAAGKSLSCAGVPGSYVCILSGLNTNSMASGTAAVVQMTLTPAATTATLGISSAQGAGVDASGLAVSAAGSGIIAVPVVSSVSCNPASLSSTTSANCSVSLSMAAPSGGSTISLASNNTLLTVPVSVAVPANAATATFTATAGASITSNQSATVTATLGSSSQTANVSLLAQALVSSLACSPVTTQSSTCTVTLSQPAPAGGSTISLSSNNMLLTVPASVVVAANTTTATFTATAAAIIPNNQGATVTATFGSSSQSANVNLLATVSVSSLACNPASLGNSASSTCTVTLSQAAPAGGSIVSLSSGNTLLTVPASVTVAANATTATFTAAAAGSIASNQNAVVTASLNSVARTFTIALVSAGATGGSGSGGSGGSGSTGGSGGGGGLGPPGGSGSSNATLTLSTEVLAFNATAGAFPGAQLLTLTYTSSTQDNPGFIGQTTVNQGTGWLSVTPANGNMTQTSFDGSTYTYQATVSVGAAAANGTADGSYGGVISFTAKATSVSINVTMNVTSESEQITVAPQSLSFTYQQGASVMPASQALSIFSNPTGATITASSTQSANWLSIGPPQGTTPATLPLSVNPGTLGPGTYATAVNIVSPIGSPVQVPVTLTVVSAPPQLSLGSSQENFALLQGGAPTSGQIVVMDTGGGTLQYSARASMDQGSWLTVTSPGSGSATPSTPAAIHFSVNPAGLLAGVYNGQITVEDTASGKQASVTIIMAVSQSTHLLTSSLSGLTFTAVQGESSPPSQSFVVYSQGAVASGWTIQVQGGNWLGVSPGSSTGTETKVAVAVSQNGLQPGQYSASLNILSPDAANSPQSVSVLLNVLPSGEATSGIEFSTGGLVFSGSAGSQMQTQQVTVFNQSDSETGYSATTISATGGSWLSVSPAVGILQPGANALTISADFSGLSPGVQTGMVSVKIDGGGVGTIQAAAIATSASATGSFRQLVRSAATIKAVAGGCVGGKPGFLVPLFMEPMAGITLPTGLAQTVRVEAVDDCGNYLSQASGDGVQVTFGNGDAALDLHDTGAGIWETTWVPQHTGALIGLNAVASSTSSAMNSVDAGILVAVQSPGTGAVPQISGVVNAALGGQGIPGVVVPGGYIAIYGTNLIAGAPGTASSLPLPSNLNGAQLFIGDQPLPLLYAGPNQVNALVPQSLNPNTSYELTVVNGSSASVPVSLIVAGLQPGIYTEDLSGSGQGLVAISGTTLLAGSVSSISRPVQSGSEFLIAYCTGLGPVIDSAGQPAPADGVAAPASILYNTTGTVTATIGGVDAPVAFSGLTPTLVGLYQVNIQVPTGVPTGDAVPLIISITDPQTGVVVRSNTVTIAVQ